MTIREPTVTTGLGLRVYAAEQGLSLVAGAAGLWETRTSWIVGLRVFKVLELEVWPRAHLVRIVRNEAPRIERR